MGGMGSGEWRVGKVTTEQSKRLDIRTLRKQGRLTPDTKSYLSWSIMDKPSGSISYVMYSHGIELDYSCTPYGGEKKSIKQFIHFDETPCHYGGIRKWFLCLSCHDRKAVLYLHGYYFTCRKCADLSYQSQHEQPLDRNYRQARKIRHKLKTDVWAGTHLEFNPDNLSHNPIFKPKGMHQTTFDRLRQEQERYINTGMQQLVTKMP